MSPSNPCAEELEQILQTIEMFEVITQSQPDDYQSFEILKEAYVKLSRHSDVMRVSRRLAEAYMNMGLYSSAMLECEAILQYEPDSADIVAMLGEVEAQMNKTNIRTRGRSSSNGDTFSGRDSGLMVTNKKQNRGTGSADVDAISPQMLERREEANATLAKFLVTSNLVSQDLVDASLGRVNQMNRDLTGQALGACLTDEVCRTGGADEEAIISALLDRANFAFVPLDYYDVDRQIVRMLPESLTLGSLIVPFDIISRTIMVAISNPFDVAAKDLVQQSLDYNVQWYLATPAAITKVLRDTYRLDSLD